MRGRGRLVDLFMADGSGELRKKKLKEMEKSKIGCFAGNSERGVWDGKIRRPDRRGHEASLALRFPRKDNTGFSEGVQKAFALAKG